MFGVIKSAWGKVKDYVYSVDTVTYSFYCFEVFGRKCYDVREGAVGWLLFLRELRKGGYITPEDFSLSVESVKRLGLGKDEIYHYIEE